MKFAIYNLPAFAELRRGRRFAIDPASERGCVEDQPQRFGVKSRYPSLVTRHGQQGNSCHLSPVTCHAPRAGFTMIEIALCLAIIGFALVSILLVLPSGMNTQRDTREETIINQDASVLMENIRAGTRGVDDLTNYIYAITNYWTDYRADGTVNSRGYNGYTYNAASLSGTPAPAMHLTNGLRIIGILSTPEFTDGSNAIPSLYFGGVSNHVVAYIRSFSGLAAEKPPQDNQIMQADTFSYRVLVVNAPVPVATNNFQPVWQDSLAYNVGDQVFIASNYNWTCWHANANTTPGEIPGISPKWAEVSVYSLELAHNQRELRLYYRWPLLPSGKLGGFDRSFRISIAGQLVATNYSYLYPNISTLYFYEPQFFSSTP